MKTSLLLVDDDSLVSRTLARSLREFPIDVVVADSFEAAVAALQEREFAAVATDFMMGKKNGPDVLAWCAEHHPSMRRVLFTGVVNPEVLSNIKATGRAHRVLLKPFPAADSYAALLETIDPH